MTKKVTIFTNEAKQIHEALQFRFNRIDEIKNYFVKEICEREIMCKKQAYCSIRF